MSELLQQADALRLSGRFDEAGRAYRESIAAGAPPGAAFYGLGLALKGAGRPQEAVAAFQMAARDPSAPLETYIEAGAIAAEAKLHDVALNWVKLAVARYPSRFEPHYCLGCMHASHGRHEEAIDCLRKALAIDPTNIEVLRALIGSLRKTKRFAEALSHARKWIDAAPNDVAAHAAIAHIHLEQGNPEGALQAAKRAAVLAPENPDLAVLQARVLALLGRTNEAFAELNRARDLAPERADIHLHLGNLLKIDGRLDEARIALRRALDLNPGEAQAYLELAEITRFKPDDPLIAQMEQFAGAGIARPAPAPMHFALGKAYDDIGKYDAAFEQFRAANWAETALARYDEKTMLGAIARIREIATPEFFSRLAGAGNESELPVFIVGMPRSGSTLVEQILASHPDVAALGEHLHLRHAMEKVLTSRAPGVLFPAYLAGLSREEISHIAEHYLSRIANMAGGKKRATDKLLANALIAGLIGVLFPRARIIYCLRDPADTCLSAYMKSFGQRIPYSTDLMTLARYHRAQSALMDYWKTQLPEGMLLEIRYENVVSDLETEARRLIGHCGLEWNDACIRFYETERPVNTASVAQVRQPLYNHAIGRWRHYAAHLGPMLEELKRGKA